MRTMAHSSDTARHTYRVCHVSQNCLLSVLKGENNFERSTEKRKNSASNIPGDVLSGANSRSPTEYQEVRTEDQQDQAHGPYPQTNLQSY